MSINLSIYDGVKGLAVDDVEAGGILNIGVRLTLGCGALIAACIAVTIYGNAMLHSLSNDMRELIDTRVVTIERLHALKDNARDIAIHAAGIALVVDEREMALEKRAIDGLEVANRDLLSSLDSSDQQAEFKSQIGVIRAAIEPFSRSLRKAVDFGLAVKYDQASDVLLRETRPLQANVFKTIDASIDEQQRLMRSAAHAVETTGQRGNRLMLIIASIGCGVGSIVAWLIIRSVTRSVRLALNATGRIAQGDLSSEVGAAGSDELGRLLGSLRHMQASLIDVVRRVRRCVEAVELASSDIARGNQEASEHAAQRSVTLTAVTADMAQLTSTVQRNADIARTATQLADEASRQAEGSAVLVDQVIVAMSAIAESSSKIGTMVGLMDTIAFQTSILSLNAATEAARAGDRGRGFAVVAAEVRVLALQSAQAAKDIKAMIVQSGDIVTAGNQAVERAGRSMGDVVTVVRKMSDLMAEISAASHKQHDRIGQVEAAISTMNQATRQDASVAEGRLEDAKSLIRQANELTHAVGVFRLPDDMAREG